MTEYEIKARQLSGQHLTSQTDIVTAATDICGVQAQFFPNAMHSLLIRSFDYNEDEIRNHFIKSWTIRGTVHVFPVCDLPIYVHADDYRNNEWTKKTFWNSRPYWALTPARQSYFTDVILSELALTDGGGLTRDELKLACRKAGMTEEEGGSMFDGWGGGIREMCERGFIHYAPTEKKTFALTPEFTPMDNDDAELELARRYFTNIAPSTVHDAMYFFHTTAAKVKSWLQRLPVTPVECGSRTYYYIETDRNINDIPRCIFLAGFDQLMLGYEKRESLYLKEDDLRRIFNLAGIVMPALLIDGSVAGKWKKTSRTVRIDLFHTIDSSTRSVICDAASSLWGDVKITFPDA